MISDQGRGSIVQIGDIHLQQIDTHGFEKEEANGPESSAFEMEEAPNKKKVFYETAKFNPRSLIDLVDLASSSCNEAEEEAHLPEINNFNFRYPMRIFRGIR